MLFPRTMKTKRKKSPRTGTTLRMMMTTRTRKKKIFNPRLRFFQHSTFPFHSLTYSRLTIVLVGLVLLTGSTTVLARSGEPQSSSKSHAHDFIIFTTVFTEQGFALPGARARVRRSEEKKFRWEATSDRRGELAIRVPQDSEY